MRRLVGFVLACLFLTVGSPFRAAADPGTGGFPPLPPGAELQARDAEEREAGAVVLEKTIELWGEGDPKWVTMGGKTRRTERVRYLVLDPRGAERLSSYAFVDLGRSAGTVVRGRTVTTSGEVIPLDPQKDVRDLDQRDHRGRVTTTVRTVSFPRVEPGAILDLEWTRSVDQLPRVELVVLGEEFPVRRLEVRSTGTLFETTATRQALRGMFTGAEVTGNLYWVPFFVGPVPERARASLDPSFDMHLEVSDIPSEVREPWAPPAHRCQPVLALMPRLLTFSKKRADDAWRKNVVLFGTGRDLPASGRERVEGDLDPDRALIRIDELGLQEAGSLDPSTELRFHQNGLRAFLVDLQTFLKDTAGAESASDVARIAPESLPAEERARRLFEHVRGRVKVVPGAESKKTLKKLLAAGEGRGWNLCAYYLYLLRSAGIPARYVFAFSRGDLPFHPIVESWQAYDVAQLIEVRPSDATVRYVPTPTRLNNFDTLAEQYVGALAFREPDRPDQDWIPFNVPVDLDTHEDYVVELGSPLPQAPDDEVPLTLSATFSGTASTYLRGTFAASVDGESPEQARQRQAEVFEGLAKRWVGAAALESGAAIDPFADPDRPLSIERTGTWRPEILEVDDEWWIPAVPPAEPFVNDFVDASRRLPLWLYGGHQRLTFTWAIPADREPAALPEPQQATGPEGLAYRLDVELVPPEDGAGTHRLRTVLDLRAPYILPASSYPEVREFFESLQQAAATRLPVKRRASS